MDLTTIGFLSIGSLIVGTNTHTHIKTITKTVCISVVLTKNVHAGAVIAKFVFSSGHSKKTQEITAAFDESFQKQKQEIERLEKDLNEERARVAKLSGSLSQTQSKLQKLDQERKKAEEQYQIQEKHLTGIIATTFYNVSSNLTPSCNRTTTGECKTNQTTECKAKAVRG